MNLTRKFFRNCSLPWMLVGALSVMLIISLNLPSIFIPNQPAGPQIPGQTIMVTSSSNAPVVSSSDAPVSSSSLFTSKVNQTGQCCEQEFEQDVDYLGGDISAATDIRSPLDCCRLCDSDPLCFLWTYAGTVCYKKTANLRPRTSSGLVSGTSCKPIPTKVFGSRSAFF
jgi:hypothetical protein